MNQGADRSGAGDGKATHFWEGWRRWRHVIKVDPDRALPPARLQQVLDCGTDAAIVGGTQGISAAKVSATLQALGGASFPVVVEVSSPECLVLGASAFFIPVVLNAGETKWVVGAHQEALAKYLRLTGAGGQAGTVPWSVMCPEGYIVLNPHSAVGQLTRARTALAAREALAYAKAGEGLFRLPIIYLEYSGTYGEEGLVEEVRAGLEAAHLFYGGGIDSPEKARRMAAAADTVVIGNLVYTGSGTDLRETVQAIRETSATESVSDT